MLSYSAIALILNNLVPLFGVIFLDWNFSNIIFLYWFENIVIGFFTVVKMVLVKQQTANNSSVQNSFKLLSFYKFTIILFFIFHFGAFTIGHGIFLLAFFGEYINFQNNLLIAILTMFLSHGISLIVNYIKPKKFLKTSEIILMSVPYPRIFVVHLTVILAGFFMINNFYSIPLLIFFVLLKTTVDLASHLFEHRQNNPKKINPLLEKFLLRAFKTSIKMGEWNDIAQDMDPEERKKVEDFYREKGVDI
jgi:hypothetical protein